MVILNARWELILLSLHHEFQPVINPATGEVFAVEARLRGYVEAGFSTLEDLLSAAGNDGIAFRLDLALREKAFSAFRLTPASKTFRLFYNYDHRVNSMKDFDPAIGESMIQSYGFSPFQVCFELSEMHPISEFHELSNFVIRSNEHGIGFVLRDFGGGFTCFRFFYNINPQFIKFDRFLIENISADLKKKTFCMHISSLAKLLGTVVIAEGIDSEPDLAACMGAGIDLVQGSFIAPSALPENLNRLVYSEIRDQDQNGRRAGERDADLVSREITQIEPVVVTESISQLLHRFRENTHAQFFPVVDTSGHPLGIVHEREIKKYLYSPYGQDLLRNKSVIGSLLSLLERRPIVDIGMPEETILEIFVKNRNPEGLIVVKDLVYAGVLSMQALLTIINEKNLIRAQELNPLTKLPGNIPVTRYIQNQCSLTDRTSFLIYFDFDYFKPFNDKFGFRQGDRVLSLFAEILQKHYTETDCFVGHIGGDDFFVGVSTAAMSKENEIRRISELLSKFAESVEPFYEKEEVLRGSYSSVDRNGIPREFPLLTATAAVIQLLSCNGPRTLSAENLTVKLADIKHIAKVSGDKISVHTLF